MFMNLLFDIILVVTLLSGAIIGYKHGFVETVAKPVKFILAFVLAFSLAKTVGTYLVEPIIGPAISHKFSAILIEKYSDITAANADKQLPTLVKMAAGMCGVDVQNIVSTADGVSVIEAVANAVTAPIIDIVSVILGFVIAYFASKLILKFVLMLINSAVKNGIAGKVNRTLGCVISLFLAFVVGWAFTSVCEFTFNIPAIASTDAISAFSGGPIYKFFRIFTPLDLLLSF